MTGAITGALAGALVGWIIAPTRAEREERGRKRLEGRRQIADSIVGLRYTVSQARQRLYRLEQFDNSELHHAAVHFAYVTRVYSLPLPRLERLRLRRKVRQIIGKQLCRLAELRPQSEHPRPGDSATLISIADTRSSVKDTPFDVALRMEKPTHPHWDKLLDLLGDLQQRYS